VKTAGQKAETQTTLVYKLEYRLYRSGRRSVASLKSIDVRAMFIPSRSWNREPRNARLLDHEQGHFDITHIAALRVRLRFATSKRISGSGLDDEQAIQDLQQQVDRSFRLFAEEDKIRAAHVEYDEITRHGAESGPQEEQRRRQKDEIAKLTERLKDNALQD
jgi:hypothetical protein